MTDAARAPGRQEVWGRGSRNLCPAGSRSQEPGARPRTSGPRALAVPATCAPCPSREEALTSLRVLRVRHRWVPGVLCPGTCTC